jgi:hypothetical protein
MQLGIHVPMFQKSQMLPSSGRSGDRHSGSIDTLTSKDSNLVLSPFFVHLINLRYTVKGMTYRLIEIGICYGMEMNAEKTKVMRILRQPSTVKIMIDQK